MYILVGFGGGGFYGDRHESLDYILGKKFS